MHLIESTSPNLYAFPKTGCKMESEILAGKFIVQLNCAQMHYFNSLPLKHYRAHRIFTQFHWTVVEGKTIVFYSYPRQLIIQVRKATLLAEALVRFIVELELAVKNGTIKFVTTKSVRQS